MAVSPAESKRLNACGSRGDAARDDPVDEDDERDDEKRRGDDADDDDVQGIQLARVALEVARLAHAEERPADRAHSAPERPLAAHRFPALGAGRLVHDSDTAEERTVATGSAGTLPPTTKKGYDSVIVFTSFGSLESTTKTTGQRFDSPACNTCWLKQKHSSLVKSAIATLGA